MNKVTPFFTPHMATRGAAISTEHPHEGATYPYPLLIALSDQKEPLVHDLVQVIHKHYDEYKDADPGGIGWALDRQVFKWEVPFHDGAIRYFKSIGVWGDEEDAHNNTLIKRQQVLATAWQAHTDAGGDAKAWYPRRAEALKAAGFDPIWTSGEEE